MALVLSKNLMFIFYKEKLLVSIGKRLREARKEAGMTQVMLSKISQIDQARISALESGVQKSSVYLVRLATALGVDPVWLETGKETKFVKNEYTAVELELLNLLRQMSDEERAREISYIQKLISQRSKL